MAIAAYHSWREMIYHLFGTDLLWSISNLFLSVSFEKLSFWWCNNTAMIVSLSVIVEHLSRYQDVSLTSYMMHNVNVNVNNYLCFTLSCEAFGWRTIAKYQALEIFYHSHSGAVEGVVGEDKSVSWGGAQNKVKLHKRERTNKMLLHSGLLISLGSYLTPIF